MFANQAESFEFLKVQPTVIVKVIIQEQGSIFDGAWNQVPTSAASNNPTAKSLLSIKRGNMTLQNGAVQVGGQSTTTFSGKAKLAAQDGFVFVRSSDIRKKK